MNNLPIDPPVRGIYDLSGALAPGQVRNIENIISQSKYNPKVVVLPRGNFDTRQVTMMLKDQWQITGDRLLLVVNPSKREARAISGNALNDHGVTGDFLNREGMQHNFIPHMKRKDLEGAIQSFIGCVEVKYTSETRPVTNVVQAQAPVHYDVNPLFAGSLIVGCAIFLYFLFKSIQFKYSEMRLKEQQKVLAENITELEALEGTEEFFKSVEKVTEKLDKLKLTPKKDKAVLMDQISEMMVSLNEMAGRLRKPKTQPEPSYTTYYGELNPSPKAKKSSRRNTNINIVTSNVTYNEPAWAPSSYSSESSSSGSSSSSWGDSGSSSWSSSDYSSSDSGSSSYDSGSSSCGDSGSSSW